MTRVAGIKHSRRKVGAPGMEGGGCKIHRKDNYIGKIFNDLLKSTTVYTFIAGIMRHSMGF